MNKTTSVEITILNAPPFSGKDYAADYLTETYSNTKKLQFKDKLIELVKAIYSLSDAEFNTMYERDNKEQPQHKLGGLSIREAMIFVSEDVIKPKYGKEYFGKQTATKIINMIDYTKPTNKFVISDGGFKEELIELNSSLQSRLYETLGIGITFKVMRLYRAGCGFQGDSRRYLEPDEAEFATFYDVINNSDKNFLSIIECYHAD